MTQNSEPKSATELSRRLGYTFKDPRILELACVHKSYGNERRAAEAIGQRNNERMEFLGDAVLDFIVSKLLLESFPECTEGDLSKLRAGLVNERTLAAVARELDLGSYILLGKGEEHTGGRTKDSILASTFEAIVAAIYSDGGFQAVESWVSELFATRVHDSQDQDSLQDYKTRLQEIVQARFKSAPRYEVIQASGPDHDKTFEIRLIINDEVAATSLGKSKKEAEQSAAKQALEKLGSNHSRSKPTSKPIS
jgi:ribonuclease III